jgi:two-component system, NtrC family, nitrogen regulation response regulator NtrX
MSARLLVVDDEKGIRDALVQLFEYEGHEVSTAEDGHEGIELAEKLRPDVTFLDVKMPGLDGLDVLAKLRHHDPHAVVVMISGHGTIDTAVEATRKGAYDFLEKPLDTDRLLVTLRRALELKGLTQSVAALRRQVESRYEIVGNSFAIRQVLERVERVAPTEARVLITGENGTGKELVARAIHRLSARADRQFVEVNCAAIPSELIESALFGHVKGSFTGAISDRAGKFEQADGGTLFLDEVGDMSLEAQAKALRALEEGVVTRVGGSKAIEVDVRVIAATNKDLEAEIEAGSLPRGPLLPAERGAHPRAAAAGAPRRHSHARAAFRGYDVQTRGGDPAHASTTDAVARLLELPWPGNVRELRNTVERLMILSAGDEVRAEDVDLLVAARGGQAGVGSEILAAETFSDFKEHAERAYILQRLRENDWNVAETARQIDMPRSNLYKKIEKYGLVRDG